jgi:hypothetical protein
MRKVIELGLCGLLIIGFAISTLPAAQDKEPQNPAKEGQSSEIKELTIRNSGFRSKSTVVIRYRDTDKKIVEVIENGQSLPPEEFSRYESVMLKVLELPQIDKLLPEIDRASRRAESPNVSEESKLRDMLTLRSRLEGLDSDLARRYRDQNELLLLETLNRLTEKTAESSDLSEEEKIARLKEVLEKMRALELAKETEIRRSGLAEFGAANAARRLIEEINKSSTLSKEEKIREIKETLQHMHDMDLGGEERHRELIELEAANALRKMLRDIVRNKDLADQEKAKQLDRILEEARDMKLKTAKMTLDVEKFKFDLRRLLKKEGLLPEGKGEFVLKLNECLIDGKKLPKEIHKKILALCEESLGKKFTGDTKIVLDLNEDR